MRQAESGAADLVALAGELRPLLAKNAEQAERDRRLPDENVRALEARNLFKVRVRLSPGCAGRAPIRWLREMYSSQNISYCRRQRSLAGSFRIGGIH